MELDEFLDTMSEQIRNPKVGVMARKEMENHIRDQAQAYEEMGMGRDEAISKAVGQMGDPVTTGVELDRIHRPKMEWGLFVWIVLFSILGLVIQYVCFYGLEEIRSQEVWGGGMENFIRQCVYTAAGLAVMAGVCLLDYSVIGKYAGIGGFAFLGTIGLLCSLDILPHINGGHPYLKSLTYLFVPLYGGILYKNRGRGYRGAGAGLLWLWGLFFVGARCIGSGLGVILNAILACLCLLLLAVWKEWFGFTRKAGLGVLAVLTLVMCILMSKGLAPYQLRRIQVWLHPEDFANTAGYQIHTIRNIVSSLSLNRSSYGLLEQRGLAEFLRNLGVYSEFMFLQTAVTLGVMKTVCLCLLFAAFLMYLLRMAMRQKNQLGQIMGLGCTLVLTAEIVGNVLSNFGLGIVSTEGIPFFSYGKWHTLVVYILFGILLGIYRYENLVWDEPVRVRRERGVIARIGDYVIRVEKRQGGLSEIE